MIVADSPAHKIGLKLRHLRLGHDYVVRFKTRGSIRIWVHRSVTLVDLRSGNKAVVQWSEKAYDKPMGERDRKVINRARMAVVSCADILATQETWDKYPKVWNAKRKRLMLDTGEQEQMSL